MMFASALRRSRVPRGARLGILCSNACFTRSSRTQLQREFSRHRRYPAVRPVTHSIGGMPYAVVFAMLLLVGCATARSDKAGRVAQAISAPRADDVSDPEMRECLNNTRRIAKNVQA